MEYWSDAGQQSSNPALHFSNTPWIEARAPYSTSFTRVKVPPVRAATCSMRDF